MEPRSMINQSHAFRTCPPHNSNQSDPLAPHHRDGSETLLESFIAVFSAFVCNGIHLDMDRRLGFLAHQCSTLTFSPHKILK